MINLDDENTYKIDSGGVFKALHRFPEMCLEARENANRVKIPITQYENILLLGMGGSAIGGLLLRDYLSDTAKHPMIITRDYHAPEFVGPKTLAIATSYSGNTEENLNALNEALIRGAQAITLTSGGVLAKESEKRDTPCLQLTPNQTP